MQERHINKLDQPIHTKEEIHLTNHPTTIIQIQGQAITAVDLLEIIHHFLIEVVGHNSGHLEPLKAVTIVLQVEVDIAVDLLVDQEVAQVVAQEVVAR